MPNHWLTSISCENLLRKYASWSILFCQSTNVLAYMTDPSGPMVCIVCVLIKNCNSVWRGLQITQQDAALQKLRIMSAPASLFLQHQWPPVKRLQSANFAMPLFLPVITTVWCRVFQESPTNVQTTDEQADKKQKNKQATWTDKQKHTSDNNMNKQTIKTHKQHEQPNKNIKQKKKT